MGQQLEEKRSVVGIEVLAGDLADADAVLPFCDGWLDLGTAVVVGNDVFGIAQRVVGDEGLNGVFEVGPELDLLAGVAVEVASSNDAKGAFGTSPASTLKWDLGNLPQGHTVSVDLNGAPVFGEDNGAHQVSGELELDVEEGSRSVDFTKNLRAIGASIHAHGQRNSPSQVRDDFSDVASDRLSVVVAETVIARPQLCPAAASRLRDDGQTLATSVRSLFPPPPLFDQRQQAF